MRQLAHRDEQLELQNREIREMNDRINRLTDLLLKQQAASSKQQALLLSQIEKGSNANSKLQSSEASGLSQVFKDQTLSQESNPNTTSLVGNDEG